MLKLIFGFLGLLVALAIAASLARSQLGWTLPFGPAPAKAAGGPGGPGGAVVTGGRAAAEPAPGARPPGATTVARPRPPQEQPAPDGVQEKSVFQRQDEALRRSAERYRRGDP